MSWTSSMPLRPFMVFSFCNLFFYNKVNEVNYMNTIIKKVNKNIYIIDQQMVRDAYDQQSVS